MLTFIWIAAGTVGGTAVLWIACSRLEASTHRLAEHYGIPEMVKGSVLMAVASSMPEIAVALLAFPVHKDFELGMSAIIGSAIYNILVIPAFSVYAAGKPIKANRDLIYREAQFYLVSVAAIMVVLSLSVIYFGGVETLDSGRRLFHGEFTRLLALIPILLYGLYLFMQLQEVKSARHVTPRREGINALKEWTVLVGMVAVILVGVEMLLRSTLLLADTLHTPTFLWGMTVVAAATSLPDTFLSVKSSRLGRTDASLSNVFGSNVFDLLVAVPAAVLVAGALTVNFSQIVPMMTFLVIATIALLTFMLRDLELKRSEAHAMLALYVVFGAWMALEAFGVTHLLALG
ncbi:MAG: sodium:calcium antiporter [Gemmatimonadetes bacterium]|nr:sodium:calcium antiporter [Gemmatimonadota bacterium]